jgi:hypothetical protein
VHFSLLPGGVASAVHFGKTNAKEGSTPEVGLFSVGCTFGIPGTPASFGIPGTPASFGIRGAPVILGTPAAPIIPGTPGAPVLGTPAFASFVDAEAIGIALEGADVRRLVHSTRVVV